MTIDAPGATPSVPARHVAAVVAGSALEFYDFVTYSFFAVYIGRAFFPSNVPSASLLASLATFGVGFVTRPIGAFVIGGMGDRVGRKPAMVLCFSLMGISITGLALTPSHARIGVAAPVLVIFFRLLQGFALGGDVGPTTSFLLEAAPANRRGFYTAFQSWSQSVATLGSGLVGFGLSSLLSEKQLQDFGWRIAFLSGAVIIPFGLWLRRDLPETFRAPAGVKGERVALRPHLWVAFLCVILLANGTIGTYVRNYITTYAIATLHMPANVAFGATIVVGLTGLAFGLVSGILADRFGRKPVMVLFGTLSLLSIVPCFYVISHYRTTATLLGATTVLSSLAGMSISPIITSLSESLPAAIRSGGVAVVYAVAITVFGGTTQYAVTWLIRATGNPLAPAWYWTVSAAIALAAMIAMRETLPRELRQPRTWNAVNQREAVALDD